MHTETKIGLEGLREVLASWKGLPVMVSVDYTPPGLSPVPLMQVTGTLGGANRVESVGAGAQSYSIGTAGSGFIVEPSMVSEGLHVSNLPHNQETICVSLVDCMSLTVALTAD